MSRQIPAPRDGGTSEHAGQPGAPRLFEADPQSVTSLMPSITRGSEVLADLMRAGNPAWDRQDDDPDEEIDSEAPMLSRKMIRDNLGIYGAPVRRFIRAGAHFVTSYEDPEEGIRIGREQLTEEGADFLLVLWNKNVVRLCGPLRALQQVSREAESEVETAMDASPESRYALLKLLATETGEDRTATREHFGADPEDWRPVTTLSLMLSLRGSDVHQRLSRELASGAFDTFIAHDLLQFVESRGDLPNDLAKVRRLATFVTTFLGAPQDNKAEFYNRMVSALNTWPAEALEAVIDSRATLADRMNIHLQRAARWLKDNSLAEVSDPKANLDGSLVNLVNEFLKRAHISGPAKAEIMRLRAGAKRRKGPQGTGPSKARRGKSGPQAQAATAEVSQEPLKVVTCHLNDHTMSEGVQGLIDDFVTRASQGDVSVRQDLERMVQHMARTDLPPTQRRGFVAIQGSRVRFGEDDRLWDFFEFKPSEAAGLSLRTTPAKTSRIYFIRLDDGSIGVIGIEPRSEQDAFLQRIKNKTKRRE